MCGYLAVDDDEAAGGHKEEELNAIGAEDGWVRLTAVVDSGACGNVLPQKELPFIHTTPTAGFQSWTRLLWAQRGAHSELLAKRRRW